jgi:multiple sugar transport system substrate-binding protein
MRWLKRPLYLLPLLMLGGCQTLSDEDAVRVASWGNLGDDSEFNQIVNDLYEGFEETHPSYDLQVERSPDPQQYRHKMLLSYIAGSTPDVMALDASSAADFIENDLIVDLTPYFEADPEFDIDDYYENVVEIAARDGEVYAVPVGFTPLVMYYNKRLFDEAGVEYPQPGWTYDDFLEKAQAITRREGDDQVWGYQFANWMPGWIMWLWNNGGDVLSPDGRQAMGYLNSPETVEAVQFVDDIVNRYRVAPSLSQAAAQGVDYFANGEAAMIISGHWSLISYANAPKDRQTGEPLVRLSDLGIVELPSNLPESVTVMYESGLSIGSQAANPEGAWDYIKYFMSFDNQLRYNSTGVEISAKIPVAEENSEFDRERALERIRENNPDISRRELELALADERAKAELQQQFLDLVPRARGPWGARVEGYTVVEDIGESMMDGILQNDIDPEEALTEAAREIDRELARVRRE